jgi:WD40 repeat protein
VLNESLKPSHGNLPSLPGKTLLPVKKLEDIDKRRDGLEKYLQGLASKVDVYASKTFVHFLELDKHKPDLELNDVEQVARITNPHLGYRDFHFVDDRKFYYAVTSDPNTVSRLDSYITNLNLPWDKNVEKDQALLAVGSLEAWGRVKKGGDIFYYEKLWVKTFKSQAICMHYSEKIHMIAVGCDSGHVGVYLLDKKDPLKYDEIYFEKVHSARVMRVFIDHKQGAVISIGEDRFLRVYDIQAKSILGEVAVSAKKLTEMSIDLKNKIAYVADRGGNINVVSFASVPPMMKQVIRTTSNGSIRGLELDLPNKRLYCTCHEDSYLHVFRIVDPADPEGRIEKVSSIKGAPNPRVVKWWEERQELVVGHQDGVVSFYNLELNPNGPVFSAKKHDKNINALQIIPKEKMLITGSNDKAIKVVSCDS